MLSPTWRCGKPIPAAAECSLGMFFEVSNNRATVLADGVETGKG